MFEAGSREPAMQVSPDRSAGPAHVQVRYGPGRAGRERTPRGERYRPALRRWPGPLRGLLTMIGDGGRQKVWPYITLVSKPSGQVALGSVDSHNRTEIGR